MNLLKKARGRITTEKILKIHEKNNIFIEKNFQVIVDQTLRFDVEVSL